MTGSAAGDESVDPADEAENDEVNGSDASASKPSTRTSAQDRERDKELVALAQKGDQDAFRELFDRYHRRAFAVALGVVKNKQDALDIIQDAFIKVHKHIQSFQGTASFYTWLYRITTNTAKNYLITAGRRPVCYGLDLQDPKQNEVFAKLKDTDTPEGLTLSEEIRQTVNSAIQDLPEDLQTAILLREIEGMSYEDIAQVMECPMGTVRSRIFRAREAIDKRINPLL